MRKEEAEVKWRKRLEGRPDLVEKKREKARRKRERRLAEEKGEARENQTGGTGATEQVDVQEEPEAGPSQPVS